MGTFTIKTISEKMLKNFDDSGSMDPYVVLTHGSEKSQTQVALNAGKTPSWNEILTLKKTNDKEIKIEMWEKDTYSKDEAIGQAKLSVDSLDFKKGKLLQNIKLVQNGKETGVITFEIDFTAPEANNAVDRKKTMEASLIKSDSQLKVGKP